MFLPWKKSRSIGILSTLYTWIGIFVLVFAQSFAEDKSDNDLKLRNKVLEKRLVQKDLLIRELSLKRNRLLRELLKVKSSLKKDAYKQSLELNSEMSAEELNKVLTLELNAYKLSVLKQEQSLIRLELLLEEKFETLSVPQKDQEEIKRMLTEVRKQNLKDLISSSELFKNDTATVVSKNLELNTVVIDLGYKDGIRQTSRFKVLVDDDKVAEIEVVLVDRSVSIAVPVKGKLRDVPIGASVVKK